VGAPIHAIQSWVAPPNGEEETAPAFAHHEGDDPPAHRDGGVWLASLGGRRVLALRAGVKVHSPLFYVHVVPEPGAHIALRGSMQSAQPFSFPARRKLTGTRSRQRKWRCSAAVQRRRAF